MNNILSRILSLYPELDYSDFYPSPGATIHLSDDGDGPQITLWEHPRIPQPSAQQLIDAGPTIERNRLAQSATAKRWDVMTGGLTLPSGVAIGTTTDDQNRITSVVANAALAGLTDSDEVDFKATSGWVRITIAQVKEIAGVLGQFVQACYSAERQHHEAIALLGPEDFDAYDLDAYWPPTDLTGPAA